MVFFLIRKVWKNIKHLFSSETNYKNIYTYSKGKPSSLKRKRNKVHHLHEIIMSFIFCWNSQANLYPIQNEKEQRHEQWVYFKAPSLFKFICFLKASSPLHCIWKISTTTDLNLLYKLWCTEITEILFRQQKQNICAVCLLSLWLDNWSFRGLQSQE